MKKLFIVANWKSNKTLQEAEQWFAEFPISNFQVSNNKEIIICPPFTLLYNLTSYIVNHKSLFQVGAQDISPFAEGAYTGEVAARQVKEFAEYVIIGHSERRIHFGENNAMIEKKLDMAKEYGITPILCVSSIEQLLSLNSHFLTFNLMVAYEPLFAIGSGQADNPDNAENIAIAIKEKLGEVAVLYGGSVTAENVHRFTSMSHINGVLVGGASLDPQAFISIITNA